MHPKFILSKKKKTLKGGTFPIPLAPLGYMALMTAPLIISGALGPITNKIGEKIKNWIWPDKKQDFSNFENDINDEPFPPYVGKGKRKVNRTKVYYSSTGAGRHIHSKSFKTRPVKKYKGKGVSAQINYNNGPLP